MELDRAVRELQVTVSPVPTLKIARRTQVIETLEAKLDWRRNDATPALNRSSGSISGWRDRCGLVRTPERPRDKSVRFHRLNKVPQISDAGRAATLRCGDCLSDQLK